MGKPRKHSQKSEFEEIFAYQLKQAGLPAPVRQHPFAKCVSRLYKADFAWPDERLIVEINGGGWVGGRHNTGQGYEDDLERTAIATYESVFGNAPSGNIPQDAFLIFDLVLISAEDN